MSLSMSEHTARRPVLGTAASAEIFTRIITHGPVSRLDIGRLTGLSQAKVTKTVSPLIADGFVTVGEHAEHAFPGRPVRPLSVVPRSMIAVGVKVNADEIFAVTVSLGNEVIGSTRRRLTSHAPDATITAIVKSVETLIDQLGDDARFLTGVGVSVSGDIDNTDGVVRDSPCSAGPTSPSAARSRPGSASRSSSRTTCAHSPRRSSGSVWERTPTPSPSSRSARASAAGST